MSNFPSIQGLLDNGVTISTFSPASLGSVAFKNVTVADVAGATTAIFTPFRISVGILVTQLWIYIGSANGNNVDLGIYNTDGVRLVSTGATAEGTTSAIQTIDITDTYLGPGTYYFAHSESNTTGTIKGQTLGAAGMLQALGMAQTASAHPLPATATLASITATQIPMMGLTTRSVV